MAEPDAETALILLGGTQPVGEAQLARLYSYPDHLEKCWIRSNFISSIDGGATADGKSGALAGPGDRTLFQLMRALADVVVDGDVAGALDPVPTAPAPVDLSATPVARTREITLGMGMGPGMGGGMMSEDDMAALDAATGVEATRLFLNGMIAHHQGAVTMAQSVLTNGQNTDVAALAQQIIDGQTAEITTMQDILASL